MASNPVKIPPDPKILVAVQPCVGDYIMSTPGITALRRAFPNSVIDILVAIRSKPAVERNPDISNILVSCSD